MTRFLSAVCVFASVIIAFLGLALGKNSPESIAVLCGTFLGAGLGAKVYQRSIEAAEGVQNEQESTVSQNVPCGSCKCLNVLESAKNEVEK